MTDFFYCIGAAGKEWGDAERAEWFTHAQKCERGTRDYKIEVLDLLEPLKETFDIQQYGVSERGRVYIYVCMCVSERE